MFRLYYVLQLFLLLLLLLTNVFAQYGTDCLLPNQEKNGSCVPITSCKTTLEFLNKILLNPGGLPTPSERDELLAVQCGQTKKGPLVCCSEDEIQLNPEGLAILKNTTCGQYSTDKVSHGYDAVLFGFPWMALLKYNDRLVPFKCGGTIISDQYILTAAHCITPELEGVRLGEHQISTERDCTNIRRKSICAPPVEDIDFDDIIVHEKYARNLYHDIALLRLKRKIQFQRHIKPVCLPIYDDLRNKSYEQYVISGWGTTDNGTLADVLQVAVVPKVEHEQCQSWLRTHGLRLPLTMGQICAGGKSLVDTCKGDSGGPLGYRDFYNGYPRFIQFGVVSFGLNSCGGVDVPTSYTNTSYYMQWITDHMR